MGMTTKQTTAFNLHKAINDNLVAIKAVRVASKDDHFEKTITVEQFKDDLDFYLESGIFADYIDFKYELYNGHLNVYAGNMSCYCNVCILVELDVNDGASVIELNNVLRKVED